MHRKVKLFYNLALLGCIENLEPFSSQRNFTALHSNTKPFKNAKMSGNGIPPIFVRETGSSKFAGSRESGKQDPAGNKHYESATVKPVLSLSLV